MAVSRHLGFYRIGNSAIQSAFPGNPSVEPNMEWIGCTVCEIFAFKLYCDLETGVWGHSRSSKVTPFDSLLMVSYYRPIVTLCLKCTVFVISRHIGQKLPKKLAPLSFGTFILGGPLWIPFQKLESWGYQMVYISWSCFRSASAVNFCTLITKVICYKRLAACPYEFLIVFEWFLSEVW